MKGLRTVFDNKLLNNHTVCYMYISWLQIIIISDLITFPRVCVSAVEVDPLDIPR